MSMRTIVIALAAPLLLAAACVQDQGPDGTLTVLASDATGGVAAEYRAGPDLVRIALRRIAIEADGSGTIRFIPVDPGATGFQVEVWMEDVQREIQIIWRGGKVAIESRGASAADKNLSVALFVDAMDALAASERPIPTSERRALVALAEAVASHPGFDERVEPYDDTQGCAGTANPPTFSITSVFGTGTIECVEGGSYRGAVCISGDRHPTWWYSGGELGCNETEMKKFEDPKGGETLVIELDGADKADVWCGELGKTYDYTTTVKMVKDDDWFYDDWKDMGESASASHICGKG